MCFGNSSHRRSSFLNLKFETIGSPRDGPFSSFRDKLTYRATQRSIARALTQICLVIDGWTAGLRKWPRSFAWKLNADTSEKSHLLPGLLFAFSAGFHSGGRNPGARNRTSALGRERTPGKG